MLLIYSFVYLRFTSFWFLLWPWCRLDPYSFWLLLWYLRFTMLLIYSFVYLRFTASDYSFGHGAVWSLQSSDYPFGILDLPCCLIYPFGFWLPLWYLLAICLDPYSLLITPLVSLAMVLSDPYSFWLLLWYLHFSYVLLITPLYLRSSDYPSGILDLPLLLLSGHS